MIRTIVSALLLVPIAPAAATENEIVVPEPILKTESPCITEKQRELDARLTGVHPTCSELTTKDAPVARRVGSDWILVIPDTQNGTYLIIGIAPATENESPSITWQGASLDAAIFHACAASGQGKGNQDDQTQP